MSKIFPLAGDTPLPQSYQFYKDLGHPLLSDGMPQQLMMTADEVRASTEQVARGCVGLFDTAQPDQKRFGRTFSEIWANCCARQFRLLAPLQYHWVTCPTHGPRPLVLVQWAEIALAPREMVRKQTKSGFLSGR